MEHPRQDGPEMSEESFLAWAEAQEERYELVEGTVVMQAGATRDHERVAKRIFAALYAQIDETRFDVNKGDFGVRVGTGSGRGSVLYPDVLIDRQSDRGDERATMTPVVIVEVLSASTDLAHHVEKLARYRVRDTLRHYAVFAQKAPLAYLWTRTEAGWPAEPTVIEGLSGRVALPAVGAAITLAEVFRKTEPRSDFETD